MLHRRILALQAGLAQFDVPAAEIIPDKTVQFIADQRKLILLHIIRYACQHLIKALQDPLVDRRSMSEIDRLIEVFQLQLYEPGRIPDLVDEVPAGLDLLGAETQILSRCGIRRQEETQRIYAVCIDDIHRIDAVAQRL